VYILGGTAGTTGTAGEEWKIGENWKKKAERDICMIACRTIGSLK
jgi:hypothetical protein